LNGNRAAWEVSGSMKSSDDSFGLLFQAGWAMDRPVGGLRIGFTLVRQLAQLYEVEVVATGKGPRQGSAFSLLLPALESARPQSPPTEFPRLSYSAPAVLSRAEVKACVFKPMREACKVAKLDFLSISQSMRRLRLLPQGGVMAIVRKPTTADVPLTSILLLVTLAFLIITGGVALIIR
jgi:hypothetical protein